MFNFLGFHISSPRADTVIATFINQAPAKQRTLFARLVYSVILACALTACSSLPKNDEAKDSARATSQANSQASGQRHGKLAQRAPANDLLARIANGFTLPELESEHVAEFERWSAEHPTYLNNLFARSEPFLFYIVEQIEARGLPMELALLPAVESAYKTDAVSRSNAVGLWQFIASTGHEYGLQQDWWYDGRRDVMASTNAALDYLTVLHKRFDNDWFLALAAYNGGQGNLARSIKANENNDLQTDYLALDLRLETRRYVPKLIALRNIVRNPEKYGVSLPNIPNRAAFARVPLNGQVDLHALAAQARLDADQLTQLNAGFLRWASPPLSSSASHNGTIALLVPSTDSEVLASVQNALRNNPNLSLAAHRVVQGDTLDRIARRYGVSVAALQQANNLASTTIRLGHTLRVPVKALAQATSTSATSTARLAVAPSATTQLAQSESSHAASSFALISSAHAEATSAAAAPAQSWVEHQVTRGETLWSIAQRYRVSVSDIVQWNKLSLERPLQLNQVLRVLF